MENRQSIYICDGTVEGLLTSLYDSYYGADHVYDITFEGNYQPNFTYEYKHISTNYDSAQKVAFAIKSKISQFTFKNMVNAWLSGAHLCGHHILEYIKLGFTIGWEVNNMLTHDNVAFIHLMNRKY